MILNLIPFHTLLIVALGFYWWRKVASRRLSSLWASGSADQVISGKYYNQAVRVHHRMLEALEKCSLKLSSIKEMKTRILRELELSQVRWRRSPVRVVWTTPYTCLFATGLVAKAHCIFSNFLVSVVWMYWKSKRHGKTTWFGRSDKKSLRFA